MHRLLLLVALLLAGCGTQQNRSAPDPAPDEAAEPLLQTSKQVYEMERTQDALTLTIPLTFENRTGQTVYINTCQVPSPPSLQKQIDGAWQTVYAPPQLMCLGPPVVIEAGASYDYVFEMHASLDPNTHPRWQVERTEGTYRLVWQLYSRHEPDQPATDLLPLEQRVSNTFQITE